MTSLSSSPHSLHFIWINKKFIMLKNELWHSSGDMCVCMCLCVTSEKSVNGTQSAMCQWDKTKPEKKLRASAGPSLLLVAVCVARMMSSQHNPIEAKHRRHWQKNLFLNFVIILSTLMRLPMCDSTYRSAVYELLFALEHNKENTWKKKIA